jgi:uncharacterized SAM-binding protein YcdF (DUF218 family)
LAEVFDMDRYHRELALTIWNYHLLHHELQKANCILALGSHDTRVAERGAQLYLDGWAPLLVFSGGWGNFTRNRWDRAEAEVFADIALKAGVPADRILIEAKSTNTGENVALSRELLNVKGLCPRKVIAVHKPYMERRTYATFGRLWPEVEVIVTSPAIAFDGYPTAEISEELLMNAMVGDLQRIKVYPRLGYQIEQHIPDEVWRAYEELVQLGYNKHLIKTAP